MLDRRRDRRAGRSWSATSATAWPARRRCRCGATCSRTSACPASRATARGRSPRSSPTRASGAAAGSGSIGWKTYAGPRARSTCPPSSSTSCAGSRRRRGRRERDRPAHRPRRRAARHQRGRAARRVRVGRLPDISSGVRDLLLGLRPGMTEREAVAAARLERHAALVPPDADRRDRARARPAQPGRPPDRARRPVHDRLRHLGRAQLPRRVRRRGRGGAAGRDRRLRRAAGRARTSRPSPSGTRRSTSARRAARCRRSSTAASATRSSASSSTPATRSTSTSGSTRRSARGSTIELRSGMALQVDIIPATGTDVLHDQHRGRHRARRRGAARGLADALPGGVGADRGPPLVHGRRRWGSSCTPTCCRSRTSRPDLPPFLLRPDRAMTMLG